MPEPVKSEKKEPEVKIIPSETPQPQEKINIDAETGKPVEPSGQSQASVSPEDFKKTLNQFGYELRKQREEFQAVLGRLAPKFNQPAPQAEKPKPDEEFGPDLDAIAQQDWKKGVSVIAEKRAEQIAEKKIKAMLEERDKQNQENYLKQQTTNQLDREKAWALEKTPSLNDETSDEFKGYYATYNKMLSEDPGLSSNPRAPRLVWYEWNASRDEKPSNPEAERLKRVAAGSAPQGRQTQQKKTFQLTQDEIKFCEDNKLSPARYAAMKEADFKQGVTA